MAVAVGAGPVTNAGFLALYNLISPNERQQIEHRVWSELNGIHPLANMIHSFGLYYIQNLTRVTFSRLSPLLQNRIEYNLWQANGANPMAPPNWGTMFMFHNLP